MNKGIPVALCMLALAASGGASAAGSAALPRQDGSSITYYLDGNGSRTLLVLMQGSDCNSVAHNPVINEQFSTLLEGADVLTVEKYGLTRATAWNPAGDSPDCPESYFSHDSPEQRARDYLQVIDALAGQYGYEQLVLLGGSEGAVVAALVASRREDVSALVTLNGGGRFFHDDVLYSMARELPPAALDEARAGFLGFRDSVMNAETMDLRMSGHGFRWWKSMFSLDQRATLQQVEAPLLIVQAERDESVSPGLAREQAEQLREGKSNVDFLLVENVDHKFRDDAGESRTDAVIASVRGWLGQQRVARN